MKKLNSKIFFYLSNGLSLSRAPLAFIFLCQSPNLRAIACILAMLTDSIDGFLARKANSTSKFGAIIDPLMDKFFVYFALLILFIENKISILEWVAFTSRDVAVFLFGGYLISVSLLKTYEVKSIIIGKISTALQFLFLILISLNYKIPSAAYIIFIPLSLSFLLELFLGEKDPKKN
ncbi:MAG: CDP-alcohol phosphatidyltransferase family protein [Chlamydiae bacterium]|jgi:CDP-diacylglycerol--glycerol-3-phosphate 3-phosphatidyltransferase|nr:CDP-alcohol phosphatidyltransferase family protein [Chlamydiota bacterium]